MVKFQSCMIPEGVHSTLKLWDQDQAQATSVIQFLTITIALVWLIDMEGTLGDKKWGWNTLFCICFCDIQYVYYVSF